MGLRSRPCLRECSCAVSQHTEAGGPNYEVQNQIKDSEAKVALSFQPENGMFINLLFREILLWCFPFPWNSINLVMWDRKQEQSWFMFLFIFSLFIIFPYSYLRIINEIVTHTRPSLHTETVIFQRAGEFSYSSYWNRSVLAITCESFSKHYL